ncbi:MAG: DUF4845 domain-containing protein [Chromatiales bacterium]|nr:DUF4845 domain-containing protein [Chromatiales bacterium]
MKLHHTQKGFTFWSVTITLLLIGFAVFNVLKLFPVYMESFEIESSVRGLETDRGQAYTGATAVRSAVLRSLQFNNVTSITKDEIIITRENQTYLIVVEYEVRLPYISNIDIVMSFKHQAEVPAS